LLLGAARRSFDLEIRLGTTPMAKLWSLLIAFVGNLYLAIPSLVMGLGFFLMALHSELPRIFWATVALITANVLMSLPFAMAVIYPQMVKIARRYDRLSFSLGLSSWQRIWEVEFPYLRSTMAYVFAIAFSLSLGDLGIISLFGSETFTTLPWYLYGLLGSYHSHDAAGVALVMLLLTLVVFMGIPRFVGGRDAAHR
jgi:thiamine transport system permease protein